MPALRPTWRTALVAGVLMIGGLAACGDDDGGGVSTTSSGASDTTVPEDFEIEGEVVATIAIGSGVTVDVAAGEGGVWVTSYTFGNRRTDRPRHRRGDRVRSRPERVPVRWRRGRGPCGSRTWTT